MKFTKDQKSILVGLVLGDACLQKMGSGNARLRLEHGAKQGAYLIWKVSQFPKLFQGRPKFVARKHPLTGKIYKYWRHQSNSSPELGKWRERFYGNGRKRIPANLAEILEAPIGLAVWYMDDGYYYRRDRVSYLYLGRISREEGLIVVDAFRRNFGLVGRLLDKKNKGYAVYLPPDETVKFHRLIKPFILPMFGYKIADAAQKTS